MKGRLCMRVPKIENGYVNVYDSETGNRTTIVDAGPPKNPVSVDAQGDEIAVTFDTGRTIVYDAVTLERKAAF
jgi:hypothetical protein